MLAETSLTGRPFPDSVDEAPIPGSRVRARTKHGELTVDELAEMQPGMARLMDELARRFWVLHYAAKGGNWALAAYMEQESEKLLKTMAVARPKYREDLEVFSREWFGPIAGAVEDRDLAAFDVAYGAAIRASDDYHAKYNKGFIRFRVPERPPEWFDLAPR